MQDLIARLCVVDPVELGARRSHVPEGKLFVSLDAQVLHHTQSFAASVLVQRVLDALVERGLDVLVFFAGLLLLSHGSSLLTDLLDQVLVLFEGYVVSHLLPYGVVGVHLREASPDRGLSEDESNRWLVLLVRLTAFRGR